MLHLILSTIIITGTGKSITGAHMAYTLAKKLRKECSLCSSTTSLRPAANGIIVEELKPCVMYCGPSNQAVNVVLGKVISEVVMNHYFQLYYCYRYPHTASYSGQR